MAKHFTNVFIKNLKYKGHQEAYADTTKFSTPGQLCVRVGKTKISWFIQGRVGGKRKKQNIATYPVVGLADARKLASVKLKEMKEEKPVVVQVDEPTVADLWDAYQESLDLKKKKKQPASLANEQGRWKTTIKPAIGHLLVKDITPMILSDLLDAKAKTAPVSANRLHSLLSIMFKPAMKKGWLSVHPLQWIDKPGGAEPPRRRVLSDEEIHTLWPAFDLVPSASCDILKLGLLTAQRPGELARMRWQDLDFSEQLWIIRDTKTGNDHMVPLSDQVVDILLERKHGLGDRHKQWVFPARRNSKLGHIYNCMPARNKLKKITGINDWHSHDLRRTARTLMSRLKIDTHICERVLNHSQGGIQGVYDLHTYIDEKRVALNKLANEIEKIVS